MQTVQASGASRQLMECQEAMHTVDDGGQGENLSSENIMNNLWVELKRRVHQRGPRNVKDLDGGTVSDPSPCILQPHQASYEKTQSCYLGKWR
ncbi:hypothetical protein AMELA_G00240110 [Ameiurus melas]|uniref:Uncharacterized protein n=1 Tax=Ameiurus melas TaxID=219545 RepID=A0A7J5ZXT0_AMEME|nr:hypothetical protein AMELA_G00240110 [Ameiurus melas]